MLAIPEKKNTPDHEDHELWFLLWGGTQRQWHVQISFFKSDYRPKRKEIKGHLVVQKKI